MHYCYAIWWNFPAQQQNNCIYHSHLTLKGITHSFPWCSSDCCFPLIKCSHWQNWQFSRQITIHILGHHRARNLFTSLHKGGLHKCIHHRPLTLSPTMLLSAKPSPELIREKVGGTYVMLEELGIESSSHHFPGPRNGWRQWKQGRTCGDAITGATEATCPVPRAGKWHCGSVRAGRLCPRLLPAYGALPDRRQPPSGSWRWVRRPENLPLLKWWLPASAALPKTINNKWSL